jgi:hypothetical protein
MLKMHNKNVKKKKPTIKPTASAAKQLRQSQK